MQVLEMVKSHPVPFAIGGVVILLVLLSSRSSAPSAAGYNANAAMQNSTALAQINAQTSVALGAQATERYNAGQQAALQRSALTAGIFNSMITSNANTQVALAGVNATQVKNASDAATARLQVTENAEAQKFAAARSAEVAFAKVSSDLQAHLDDNNTKMNMLVKQGDINLTLLDRQVRSNEKLADMNNAVYVNTLPQILASQQALASIQTSAARTAAQAQKNKSDWGIVTDVGSTVAKIFSMF